MNDHSDSVQQLREDYTIGFEQREQAAEDMAFMSTSSGQWDGFVPNLPNDYPRLTYDMLNDYVNRFMGESALNRVGVEYRTEGGDPKNAEILTGLNRKDFRRNNGQVAVDAAKWEAAYCGVGAFKLMADYRDEDKADSDEQIILYKPLYSAYNTVIWDRAAQRPDKADALRCTVLHEFTKERFEKEYPGRPLPNGMEPDTNYHHRFRWTGKDSVYVAEQFTVEKKTELAQIWVNVRTGQHHTLFPDELKDLSMSDFKAIGWEKLKERNVVRRSVERSLMDGSDYLPKGEPRRIAGKYIPVIPIYCHRMYVNGVELYRGMIHDKKDAQRAFNLQMSKLAEQAATTSRRVPILTGEEVSGLEDEWEEGPNDKPYMPINAVIDENGNKIKMPMAYLEPPPVDQAVGELININADYLRDRTGGAPQVTEDPDMSGKAILALQQQSDLNTHYFMDNIRLSFVHAGLVYQEMAREIYGSPRSVMLLNEDDSEKPVSLMQMQPNERGQLRPINDITQDRFEVVASVGPSYSSKREATVESMKDVISGLNEQSPFYAPVMAVMLNNMDGTGFEPIHRLARQQLLSMGIVDPETEEDMQFMEQLQAQQDGDGGEGQNNLMNAMAMEAMGNAKESEANSFQKMTAGQLNLAKVAELKAKTKQIPQDARAARVKQFSDSRTNQMKALQSGRTGSASQ